MGTVNEIIGSTNRAKLTPPNDAKSLWVSPDNQYVVSVFRRDTGEDTVCIQKTQSWQGEQARIDINGPFVESFTPIEFACLYSLKHKREDWLILCTTNYGVVILDVTDRDINDGGSFIPHENKEVRRIKTYYSKVILSPDARSLACVTGINNAVYFYDLVGDCSTYTTISTGREFCDEVVWSPDSSLVLCYRKNNPSYLYVLEPRRGTCQKIAVNSSDDQIMVRGE